MDWLTIILSVLLVLFVFAYYGSRLKIKELDTKLSAKEPFQSEGARFEGKDEHDSAAIETFHIPISILSDYLERFENDKDTILSSPANVEIVNTSLQSIFASANLLSIFTCLYNTTDKDPNAIDKFTVDGTGLDEPVKFLMTHIINSTIHWKIDFVNYPDGPRVELTRKRPSLN
ncbi:hypothetical protein [Proteus mirabilis]|uniref:hypothetical protein n=1 Tax=Proteus mirabilis TaxID=584 RepID=UPI0034D78D27